LTFGRSNADNKLYRRQPARRKATGTFDDVLMSLIPK
jgi:hypothetical protein